MERVVSAAASTRTAMGFGSGGGWRWKPSQVYTPVFRLRRCFFMFFFLSVVKATLGSGKRGFGIRVGI